jgi:sugar phosphate isomerase/epimerase
MRDLSDRLDLMSVNTATFGHQWPIARTIELLASQGVGGISPWRREVEEGDESVATVARQIRDAGLTVTGYCRSAYLTGPTKHERQAGIDDNKKAIDAAAEIGSPCFIMVMGSVTDGSRDLAGAREQSLESLAVLLEHGRGAAVALALEPLHPMTAGDRSCLNTLAQAIEWCDRLDPDRTGGVGIAADVYHIWWDPALHESIARAADRLLGYHICDWLVPTTDLVLDRGMMGDGVVDLKSIRAAMESAGYDGLCEVEIFSAQNWWKRDPADTLSVAIDRFKSVV